MSDNCKHCEYVASQSDEELKMLWHCVHAALHARYPALATQQLQPEHLTEEGRKFLAQSQRDFLPEVIRGRTQ